MKFGIRKLGVRWAEWGTKDILTQFWVDLPKLVWTTLRKKCSSDRKNLLESEAEGPEFAKILRSLEQFIQTVKVQNNFW